MWIKKRKDNEQLVGEIEIVRNELKSTRRKLEEALVVRDAFNQIYHDHDQGHDQGHDSKMMPSLMMIDFLTRFLATQPPFYHPDRCQSSFSNHSHRHYHHHYHCIVICHNSMLSISLTLNLVKNWGKKWNIGVISWGLNFFSKSWWRLNQYKWDKQVNAVTSGQVKIFRVA